MTSILLVLLLLMLVLFLAMVLSFLWMVFVLVIKHLRWPEPFGHVSHPTQDAGEEAPKIDEVEQPPSVMISRPKAPPPGFGQPRGSVSAEVPMRDWNPLPAPSASWMQPDGYDQPKPSSKVMQHSDRPVTPERCNRNKISQQATTLVPQPPDVPPPVHLQGGAYVNESQMADVENHDPPTSHVAEDRRWERSDDEDERQHHDDDDADLQWSDFHGSQDQPGGSEWYDDDWKPGTASWQPNFNQRGYGSGWQGEKFHHPYAHFSAEGKAKTGWANKSSKLVEAVLAHDWQKAHDIASTFSDEHPIKGLLELRRFDKQRYSGYEIPARPY